MNSCIFCKIIAKQISSTIIAENDNVLVIKDIHPRAPIHYLIMPKKHCKDVSELENSQQAGALLLMAKQLSQDVPGATSFKLLVNNGSSAGQVVFHLHIHFLAGKQMEAF